MSVSRFRYSQRAVGAWRRPVRQSSRLWRWIFFCVVLAVIFMAAARWWRVREVTVSGAAIFPNAAIRDEILARLQTSYLWGIIPRSSLPFVGTRRLSEEISSRFALAQVDVRRHFNGTLTVSVSEQTVVGVVRFGDGNRALLSKNGQIVSSHLLNEDLISALPDEKFWFDDTKPLIAAGVQFLSREGVALIGEIWLDLLRAGGALKPASVSFHPGSDSSFDIHTSGGAIIITSTDELAALQKSKLDALLKERPLATQWVKLRSIDLRYGDRVYLREE